MTSVCTTCTYTHPELLVEGYSTFSVIFYICSKKATEIRMVLQTQSVSGDGTIGFKVLATQAWRPSPGCLPPLMSKTGPAACPCNPSAGERETGGFVELTGQPAQSVYELWVQWEIITQNQGEELLRKTSSVDHRPPYTHTQVHAHLYVNVYTKIATTVLSHSNSFRKTCILNVCVYTHQCLCWYVTVWVMDMCAPI